MAERGQWAGQPAQCVFIRAAVCVPSFLCSPNLDCSAAIWLDSSRGSRKVSPKIGTGHNVCSRSSTKPREIRPRARSHIARREDHKHGNFMPHIFSESFESRVRYYMGLFLALPVWVWVHLLELVFLFWAFFLLVCFCAQECVCTQSYL